MKESWNVVISKLADAAVCGSGGFDDVDERMTIAQSEDSATAIVETPSIDIVTIARVGPDGSSGDATSIVILKGVYELTADARRDLNRVLSSMLKRAPK